MSSISLAVKYRPQTFEDVTEQGSTVLILRRQLETGTFKNAYLFVGPAGTGKTTTARIYAKKINKGSGAPIEIDAASNNSVESIRQIIQDSQLRSFDGEYKIYIIDECHMLSNSAWNAMLKMIEEPPAKTIFIMCTTDPQKIPATILSRVQRFDLQKISFDGIVKRLKYIIEQEMCAWTEEECKRCGITSEEPMLQDNVYDNCPISATDEALEYIAKLADGGMRDAITMLDKCLSFNQEVTLETVVSALGTVNYGTMFSLTNNIIDQKEKEVIELISTIYNNGSDLKQFMKQYNLFLIDLIKYIKTNSFQYIKIPGLYKDAITQTVTGATDILYSLLKRVIKLNDSIKWEHNARALIEAELLLACVE